MQRRTPRRVGKNARSEQSRSAGAERTRRRAEPAIPQALRAPAPAPTPPPAQAYAEREEEEAPPPPKPVQAAPVPRAAPGGGGAPVPRNNQTLQIPGEISALPRPLPPPCSGPPPPSPRLPAAPAPTSPAAQAQTLNPPVVSLRLRRAWLPARPRRRRAIASRSSRSWIASQTRSICRRFARHRTWTRLSASRSSARRANRPRRCETRGRPRRDRPRGAGTRRCSRAPWVGGDRSAPRRGRSDRDPVRPKRPSARSSWGCADARRRVLHE